MFENYWYAFMAILLLLNGSFVALSFMPANNAGTLTLGQVWGTGIVTDMNHSIDVFSSQIDFNYPTDTNSSATTTEDTKVDIFKTLLFGLNTFIGGAYALLSFVKQVFFGYFLWIDFLLNPAWSPVVAAMGLMLKTVMFLIEIVGIVSFAKGFFIFRNLF